jgi:hypothetical protein
MKVSISIPSSYTKNRIVIYKPGVILNINNLEHGFNWITDPTTRSKWAFGCGWHGDDLDNVQSKGEQCAVMCRLTLDCTHFSWTKFRAGTCFLKNGKVVVKSVVPESSPDAVCGYMIANATLGL